MTDRPGDRGSATAELAVALPALVVVLAIALAALDLGLDQVRCLDAAREGARLLARGDAPGPVREAVLRAAPDGARVDIEVGEASVRVTVSAPRPAGLDAWPGVPSAAAAAEAAKEAVW